jgi:hypothetical protein
MHIVSGLDEMHRVVASILGEKERAGFCSREEAVMS